MPSASQPPVLRIVVAVNPEAAFGRHRAVGEEVAVLLGVGHTVIEVRQPDFELLRREVERALGLGGDAPADALVVVGGDGMVSLAVNLLARSGVPFGVVPAGTGNDFARSAGVPLGDPAAAVRLLLEALDRGPRPIDAGRVSHGEHRTWFAGALSAGFDAAVNERANRMTRPKSRHRYTIAVLRELLTFRPPRYTLTVDGVERTSKAMLVACANHQSIGGGMRITPDALLDDGELDLFVVEPMSRLRFIRLLPKVFGGRHVGERSVHISRVRKVRIEAEGVIAYADGERLGSLPVEVEVVPGALRFLG